MTYEVHFQLGDAQYTASCISTTMSSRALIQGLQGTEVVPEYETRRDAAEATLKRLKYEWRGGEQWAPPIGPAPTALWYPDDSGEWVEWPGGDRPVSKNTRVDILCDSERALQSFHPQGFEADIYCWSAEAVDRIVAYKVVKPCE